MVLDPPSDLEGRDVKGGSPKTPIGGIPVQEFQQYSTYTHGNGVWKAIATGLGGIVMGLLLAWFTAYQSKGVTQKEMQEYVERFSPYSQQKDVLSAQQATQDRQIGELQALSSRAFDRVTTLDSKLHDNDREIIELRNEVKTKMDIVATLLEQQKAKK